MGVACAWDSMTSHAAHRLPLPRLKTWLWFRIKPAQTPEEVLAASKVIKVVFPVCIHLPLGHDHTVYTW